MFISREKYQKELDKELTKAFNQGYEMGKRYGELDGLMKRYTPNELREILGLPPAEECNPRDY